MTGVRQENLYSAVRYIHETESIAMVTSVTNKILPQIEEWQKRPLSAVYSIVYSNREDHTNTKLVWSFSTHKSIIKWEQ